MELKWNLHRGGFHRKKTLPLGRYTQIIIFSEIKHCEIFRYKILNTDVASQTKEHLLMEKNIQVTNQKYKKKKQKKNMSYELKVSGEWHVIRNDNQVLGHCQGCQK